MMRDPNTANCRVYVGNTKEGVTSPELTAHFSKHGQILGVSMNRGFGFIQFANEASATAAIQQENGTQFQGRKLNVRTAVKNNPTDANKGNKVPYQHPPQDCEIVGGKVVPQDLNRMPRKPLGRGGKRGGMGHGQYNSGENHPNGRDRSPHVSGNIDQGKCGKQYGKYTLHWVNFNQMSFIFRSTMGQPEPE